MANNLKHVGRLKANGRKVLVAYRTLPGDSDSALIVQTETLSDDQHDAIIKLVESPAAQSSYEFAEVMARANFPDGSIMLANLHVNGQLFKVRTSDIEMIPSNQATVSLDQLNQIIAEQKGISVNDLALGGGAQAVNIAKITDLANPDVVENNTKTEKPLDDDDLARKFRSDADKLYKEAARLRAEAEKLSPTKKKVASEE
jgi:hypothetical protein